MTDEEIHACLEDIYDQIAKVIDGKPATLVGAAMGKVLGDSVAQPEVLSVAIAQFFMNASEGRRETHGDEVHVIDGTESTSLH